MIVYNGVSTSVDIDYIWLGTSEGTITNPSSEYYGKVPNCSAAFKIVTITGETTFAIWNCNGSTKTFSPGTGIFAIKASI